MAKKLSLKEVYLSESKEYKILYHIGPRPPKPVPYKYDIEGGWKRPWLKKPVAEPVVFMSDNWQGIRAFHGRWGNVYAYKVPYEAIKASGGMHKYDMGKEVLIPKSVWDKFNLSQARTGKVIDVEKAEQIMRDKFGHGTEADFFRFRTGDRRRQTKIKPNWETIVLSQRPEEAMKLLGKDVKRQMFKDIDDFIKNGKPEGKSARDRVNYRDKLEKAIKFKKLFGNA